MKNPFKSSENLIETMPSFLDDDFEFDKTILVVDDEKHIRTALKLRLQGEGFNVILASSGKDAMEKVRNHMPNLIIMDLYMPEMTGHDAIEKMRTKFSTHAVPIIVLTASKDISDQKRAIASSADQFMTKPFKPDELIKNIKDLIYL